MKRIKNGSKLKTMTQNRIQNHRTRRKARSHRQEEEEITCWIIMAPLEEFQKVLPGP